MKTLVILLIGLFTLPSFGASLKDFKKERSKLIQLKKKCDKQSEPDRSECLEKYEKRKDKYQKELNEFKRKTALENQKRDERRSQSNKTIEEDIENRQNNIKQFEDFVKTCKDSKNSRCALAYFQLGNLNFRNEEDDFRIKQTKYEKDMQKWEDRDKKGVEPTPPTRNHDKSLQYFEIIMKDYPKYSEIPKVYYRLAFIYSIQGKDDEAFQFLDKLVKQYPDHPLYVPAQLRIGEHWYMLRSYKKAIEAYEKIPASYGGQEAALALYHKAECYYNMADFGKAAELYYDFVIRAEQGEIKGDLALEAREFMAACWADMEDGVERAYKFLHGKGHNWENDVYYQMGEKNLSHDRLEEARKAFKHLLDIDPNYPKAPQADINIVKTLVIEKRPDEAQEARISLVERYRPGSAWERANSGNKEGMADAQKAVKNAMFQIPLYYHNKAAEDKKNPNKDLLAKAESGYKAYISRYSEDSWEVYEAHQNLGAVYNLLNQYSKAAEEYAWCANANTSKYGKLSAEKKKSILTAGDAAYNQVYMLDLDRQQVVKSLGDNKEQAYAKAETRKYFDAVESYMGKFGTSNSAPDIAYNAALVHYEAKQYDKAVNSLRDLLANFKSHKHTNLIRRMLGQSLLESGNYEESEKVFAELLNNTPKNDKAYADIELSVASAIFKQADQKVKNGQHKEAAEAYMRVANKYKGVNIADKAMFEAGAQYEEAKDVPNATSTFLGLHTSFPKSELAIKSILRAASIYKKNEQFKESAETFLIVRNKFPKDSTAFSSIGWAAEAYTEGKSLAMAAKTYESAHQFFPQDVKTPSFIYNAGQTYEELEDWSNAIRVYELLGDKYAKSNYALEALFSVPLIQEKRGNFSQAVKSYETFIKKYNKDPQKLIRAQLAAGKIYQEKLNKPEEAVDYFSDVKKTFLAAKDVEIPSAIPAEAAYRAGEIYFTKVDGRKLNSSKKVNAQRLKELTKDLQESVEHFTFSLEQSEQEWTLRSTLKMGDLFMSMARITSEEKIQARSQEAILGEKIQILRGLPGLYDKARSIYQKNLDLAREQGLSGNEWIKLSEEQYMTTYLLKGQVFLDLGNILANSPIPQGLSPEEEAEYKAILEDKRYEMNQQSKVPFGTGLKAAQFYSIDNDVVARIKSVLGEIDPEAPELQLKALTDAEKDMMKNYVDDTYKANSEKIAQIFEDPSMSESKKIKMLNEMEAAAKMEIERLLKEIDKENAGPGAAASSNE